MGTLRLPRRRARSAAKPNRDFHLDAAISKLLVGNSNQRRGGGARWRGAGYPRAAVVMTPLRNATPPALRHVFSHCVIFATPLRCIIPLGAGRCRHGMDCNCIDYR